MFTCKQIRIKFQKTFHYMFQKTFCYMFQKIFHYMFWNIDFARFFSLLTSEMTLLSHLMLKLMKKMRNISLGRSVWELWGVHLLLEHWIQLG